MEIFSYIENYLTPRNKISCLLIFVETCSKSQEKKRNLNTSHIVILLKNAIFNGGTRNYASHGLNDKVYKYMFLK